MLIGSFNTYSMCRIKIKSNGKDKLHLDYIQTGKQGSEYAMLSNLDTPLSLANSESSSNILTKLDHGSNVDSFSFEYGVIPEGEHFIDVKFIKTGSTSYSPKFEFKPRFEIVED